MNPQSERLFDLVCPVCRGELVQVLPDALRCEADELTFRCEEGIWHFLPPERAAALAQFRQEYETIRQNEGRGSDDPAFYRALPFVEGVNPQITEITQIFSWRTLRPPGLKNDWAVRAASFGVLVERVVAPMARRQERPLRILDLGAGNGWLSNRLAARGHLLAAVDLGVNKWDGLGAYRHYQTEFSCWQAEFDQLPLDDHQVDLVIFNASFHYSVNYEATLREVRRVLRTDGLIVVVDTAVYQHQSSGQQMVAEREAAFAQQHGFASNALPSENFLTSARLDQLATTLQLRWRQIDTVTRWRHVVRRLKVALRRQREPAQFPIILFTAKSPEDAKSLFEEGLITKRKHKDCADLLDFSQPSFPSVANHIGRNSAWLFGARVGQQAILLLFTALVARQLGDVGLGQLAWITAVLYIGNVFSTFGLDTVLLRQIATERRTDTVPLAAALGLELIVAAIFMLGLWLVPFSEQTAVTLSGLRLYGWVLLPLALLTVTNAALRGYEQMGWLSGLTLATAGLQLGGTAVLFASGGGFYSLMGWLLVVQVISAGLGWWLCRRVLPEFGLNWRRFNSGQMWQLARIGVWLALLMGTAVLLQRLGILLLGWLGTSAQTGQLAAALRLIEAARLLPGAVMGAIFPVLAKQRGESSEWLVASGGLRSLVASYRWWLVAYGVASATALVLLARPLVTILFGEGYETAVSLLGLLAWGVIPFTISLPLSLELVVAGQEKRVLLATFFTLLGTAVLVTLAFRQQGIMGLALGLVVGECLLVAALVVAKWWQAAKRESDELT